MDDKVGCEDDDKSDEDSEHETPGVHAPEVIW
jgi:hypothetical protein